MFGSRPGSQSHHKANIRRRFNSRGAKSRGLARWHGSRGTSERAGRWAKLASEDLSGSVALPDDAESYSGSVQRLIFPQRDGQNALGRISSESVLGLVVLGWDPVKAQFGKEIRESAVCVLCGSRDATTREHIPPQSLFLEKPRQFLAVPACGELQQLDSSSPTTISEYTWLPHAELMRLWRCTEQRFEPPPVSLDTELG